MASLFFYVYPASQISAGFKTGQLFGFYHNRLAGPWIASGEWFIGFDLKRAQPPDIDSVSFGQRIGHGTEYQLDYSGGFGLGKVLLLLERLDQFALIHCKDFPLSFRSLNIKSGLTGPAGDRGSPAASMVIGTMFSILNDRLALSVDLLRMEGHFYRFLAGCALCRERPCQERP
jgi:hypothetical protein